MTIKEIARLAGVSISTVSKIMNHKDDNISPETREKVLNIVKEYNYSPYAFAKNTSVSKTFLLGVLLRGTESYGRLLEGIMTCAQRRGYRVLVCNSGMDRSLELKNITALCKAKVDGVIWEPVEEESISYRRYFEEIGACITWLHAAYPDSFSVNYQLLTYQIAEHFIQRKHTMFSLLAEPEAPEYQAVLAGYKTALFDYQIPFDPEYLLSAQASDWIFKIKTFGLTGVICTSYSKAVSLLRLLEQYQYEIPKDFSIVTMIEDSVPFLPCAELSAVAIPFYQLGVHLCENSLKQCEQHDSEVIPFLPACDLNHSATLDVSPSIKLPHIIVVGSINIDTTLNVNRLPVPGEAVISSGHTILPGGKGINQAVGVVKLNHKVTLLGSVGNDLETSLIYTCLREYGINTTGIYKDKSAYTGRAYIQVQNDGESTITLLAGANATLSPQFMLDHAQLFYNCAYCLLQTEISMEAVEMAALIAHSHGVKTILKPSSVSLLSDSLLENVDIFVPNQAEMALLCQEAPACSNQALSRQADRFLQKGVQSVIITLGEHGCFFKDSSCEQFFEAAEFPAMDNTGGSDAFISALASYLLYGYTIQDAIRIATYAAGFCISRPGIVPALIDQTSLEKYIHNVCPDLIK